MFTLTKASEETKLALKLGALGFVLLIILVMIFRVLVNVKNSLFPLPPPKPTVAFGTLPAINFPQGITNNNFTYTLNTVSGVLPTLDILTNVYTMSYTPPDLLGIQNAGQMAATLGFRSGPYQITNQLYDWTSSDNPGSSIKINIVNYDFWITSNLSLDSYIVSGNNLPNEAGAINTVKTNLQNINRFYPDIDETKTKTALFALRNNTLTPVISYADTQIIRVDLFQKDVNNLPIYYEQPNTSTMNFLVSGGQYFAHIVGANFVYQKPTSNYATYPIKTASEAFNELRVGKAYIASYYGTSQNITINNVFLAYYIGNIQQNYLMPIIVFQGNNGFYAYVSAVTDEWIGK